MRARDDRPTFFRQGLLILLPVAVLSVAGLFAVSQDRTSAEVEARTTAQTFANEYLRLIWSKLADPASPAEFQDHTFHLDATGQLLFPPPPPPLPEPRALAPGELNAAQRAEWIALEDGPGEGRQMAFIAAGRRFLDLDPPPAFSAVTEYRLASTLAKTGASGEASTTFRHLIEKFPGATSESGLPLRPLAQLKLLQAATPISRSALESFCSNVVFHPTFLTPTFLDEAERLPLSDDAAGVIESWRNELARHEALRTLAAAAQQQIDGAFPAAESEPKPSAPVPALFWFHAPDQSKHPAYISSARMISPRSNGKPPPQIFAVWTSISKTNQLSAPAPTVTPTTAPSSDRPELIREWLATRIDGADGTFRIVCRALGTRTLGTRALPTSRPILGSQWWNDLCDGLPPLPTWLGYSLDLAGVSMVSSNNLLVLMSGPTGKGTGESWSKYAPRFPPAVLASAARSERGRELLRVNIHLVSPQMLFEQQRIRAVLFGLLVAGAGLAAAVGFFSARRAFLRQQQLSDLKSNFVSSVSHELRAPLASVRLMAESLDRGRVVEPEKQREYFRFIVQECRRLGTLIENVLDYARIEQGRKQYEFEPIDLVALMQQTVKLLEPAAGEKGVTLRADREAVPLSPPPPPLQADGAALQQALINLIDNALKHSPPQADVIVALAFVPENSSYFLSVTDAGPGIPPAEHERIFERFHRLGSELRRETPGVGIGLSIVKHIVTAHGGRVWVESDVGQGSCFRIELPVDAPATHPGRKGRPA
jgi:signal transduction histidine kinase